MRNNPPWDDCKVAFEVDNPEIYDKICYGHPGFPKGWEPIELNGEGTNWFIIFRVEGMPTMADGNITKMLLDSL